MAGHVEHQPGHHTHDEHDHGALFYVKIWGILLVLFAISVIGPELGHRTVTLVTAFGIAIVKAWMVAVYFMHIRVEKRYIPYMLFGMLLIMGIFWFAVSPDVMKKDGNNWENSAAHKLIEEHHENKAAGGAPHH